MGFLSLVLNFNEDNLAFFLLDYFYIHCYKPMPKTDYFTELRIKSLHFMANLRDVLKYPKFSNSELTDMSMADINSHLFSDSKTLDCLSLKTTVFLQSRLKSMETTHKASSSVQSVLTDLSNSLAEKDLPVDLLDQYGLFIAFEDNTADICLPFDLQ